MFVELKTHATAPAIQYRNIKRIVVQIGQSRYTIEPDIYDTAGRDGLLVSTSCLPLCIEPECANEVYLYEVEPAESEA